MTRTSTRLRAAAADGLELALLEHAQELDLGLRRQLAHLVEEDRAAVGQLEAADAPLDRAGERALDVAEQLALDEPRRDGAQLTLTSAPLPAAAPAWMARAISSLPVPVSPVMSTVESVGATCSTWRSSARSGGLLPTISTKLCSRWISSWR